MGIVMRGFHRDGEDVVLTLDDEEIRILQSLVADLRKMIEPAPIQVSDPLAEIVGIDETAVEPIDEAVARLFPNAYTDDDEAATEFRRFTERGLRQRRMEQTKTVEMVFERASRGATTVSEPETRAALGVFNDLRVVLGVRLGIEQDDDGRDDFIAPEDPRRPMYVAYQWLTWLQQALLESMTAGR